MKNKGEKFIFYFATLKIIKEELNNSLKEKMLSEISTTKGMVKKDELIISKGEIVDSDKFQKLSSFEKKYS